MGLLLNLIILKIKLKTENWFSILKNKFRKLNQLNFKKIKINLFACYKVINLFY